MIEISNKYKSVIKLVNLLLPNYIFSPRKIGEDVMYYIAIHHIEESDIPNGDTWEYVGFLSLHSIHIEPSKPTDIILGIPYLVANTKKLIEDWKNIGIHFIASEDNSASDYFHYYSIGINDEDSI